MNGFTILASIVWVAAVTVTAARWEMSRTHRASVRPVSNKKTEPPTASKSVGRVTSAEGRSKVVYSKNLTASDTSNAGKAASQSPVGRTRWDVK